VKGLGFWAYLSHTQPLVQMPVLAVTREPRSLVKTDWSSLSATHARKGLYAASLILTRASHMLSSLLVQVIFQDIRLH